MSADQQTPAAAAKPAKAAKPTKNIANASIGTAADESEDQIISRGYRPYEGPRTGFWGSFFSIVFYSARYTLGIGRAFRCKLLPSFAVMVVVLPALGFAVIAAAPVQDLTATDALPDYHLYYTLPMSIALIFFCGLSLPDILVPDRRNGMLPLYFSTRIRLWSYLASKSLAAVLVSSILTVVPILLLLLAHIFEGEGPSGVGEWIILMTRIVASGIVAAVALVAVGMAIASLTDRRGVASAGVFLIMAGGALFSTLAASSGLGERSYAASVVVMTAEVVDRIYGVGPELVPAGISVAVDTSIGVQTAPVGSPGDARWTAQATGDVANLSTWFVVCVYTAWTALGVLIVWLRYRRSRVSS